MEWKLSSKRKKTQSFSSLWISDAYMVAYFGNENNDRWFSFGAPFPLYKKGIKNFHLALSSLWKLTHQFWNLIKFSNQNFLNIYVQGYLTKNQKSIKLFATNFTVDFSRIIPIYGVLMWFSHHFQINLWKKTLIFENPRQYCPEKKTLYWLTSRHFQFSLTFRLS